MIPSRTTPTSCTTTTPESQRTASSGHSARPLTLSPDEIEEEFVKVNPGLSTAGMAVICDNRRLREVRLCLTKDFRFRDCQEIDRRACRVKQIVMPPVRGARGAAAEER